MPIVTSLITPAQHSESDSGQVLTLMSTQKSPPRTPLSTTPSSPVSRPLQIGATQQSSSEAPSQKPDSQSRVKRLSSAVEKTVDKLSRSVSGSSTAQHSPSSSPARRVFSINRKPRASQQGSEASDAGKRRFPQEYLHRDLSESGSSSSPVSKTKLSNEDSPFIRPPSPPLRPPLQSSFRGDSTVRSLYHVEPLYIDLTLSSRCALGHRP